MTTQPYSDTHRGRRGAPLQDDDATLRALGYPRVLSRRMTEFSNFGISFTIISILSGCLTLYTAAMGTGGPGPLIWGWVGVGLMTLFVGLAMAEVCSAFPTSGALYYWSAKLAKRHNAAWAWYTGWFNVLGQFAITAGIDYGLATFAGAFGSLQWNFQPTAESLLAVYAVILLIHALLNTRSVRLLAIVNQVSVFWHVLGVLVIVTVLAIVPAHHQSIGFVFTHYVNDTGWTSGLYVGALALLTAQYTFTGYDASAHLTEETTSAAVSAPRGIVRSIWVSWLAGFVLLVGVTFAIQNYRAELASPTGVAPAQIFIDAVGSSGGKALLLIVIGAQFFCGLSSVTANSRMIFAFSRDGALPGSGLWRRVNTRSHTPTHAVWLAAAVAFLLVVPSIWSITAYVAVTSIATIGLYVAYGIPVMLRLARGREFADGPWSLGAWSRPIGVVSVVWVAFISVLFCLPTGSPITRGNFNYAPVAVLVVLVIATIWWFATAKRTFRGPVSYGTPEELAALESELL